MPINFNLTNLFCLGSICFSFLASVILLKNFKTYNRIPSMLLSVFFFVLGYSVFDNLLIASKWIVYFPFLYKTPLPFSYLIYPLLYLYVNTILTNKEKISIKDGLHFVPFVIVILDLLPFYLLPSNTKNNIILNELNEFSNTYLFDSDFFLPWIHYLLKQVQSLIYIFLIWRLLLKNEILNRTTSKKTPSIINIGKEKNWLVTSCSLMTLSYFIFLILVTLKILSTSQRIPDVYPNTASLAYSFSIFALCFHLFFNPYILYGLTELQIKKKQNKQNINDDDLYEETVKPILEVEKWMFLERIILEKEYFKKHGMSLERLALELNISSRQLSFCINFYKKMKFQDYMNHLRINYIISEFHNGSIKTNTIEAIGTNAGFGSRSTFFSVFKKHMKCTPLEYIKSLQNDIIV